VIKKIDKEKHEFVDLVKIVLCGLFHQPSEDNLWRLATDFECLQTYFLPFVVENDL